MSEEVQTVQTVQQSDGPDPQTVRPSDRPTIPSPGVPNWLRGPSPDIRNPDWTDRGAGSRALAAIAQVIQDLAELAQAVEAAYLLPEGGIPAADLAAAVRASLAKADTALQSLPAHTHAKSAITDFAHTHEPGDVTGLPAALDARLARAEAVDGFTVWTVTPPTYQGESLVPVFDSRNEHWLLCKESDLTTSILTPVPGQQYETSLVFDDDAPLRFTATRTRLRPTDAMETAWNAKQDALTSAQLANIAAVPGKFDKTGGTVTGIVEFISVANGDSVKIDGHIFKAAPAGAEVPDFLMFTNHAGQYPSDLTPDGSAVMTQKRHNLLPYASPTVTSGAFALAPETAVYRVAAALSGTAATIPTPDATGILNGSAYYCFEMEVSVDATATTLSGPQGWNWLDGGELPTDATDFAGKILHIAARLDCAQGARTVTANLAWTEDAQ